MAAAWSMKRERSCTGSVGFATSRLNRFNAASSFALPVCVCPRTVAAASRRSTRSAFSLARARCRCVAIFEPAHCARDSELATVVGCGFAPPPQPASVSASAATAALRSDARELRDDLLAVRPEGLLLALRHQVDVELVDADRLELLELGRRVGDVAEHAEAVDDLV